MNNSASSMIDDIDEDDDDDVDVDTTGNQGNQGDNDADDDENVEKTIPISAITCIEVEHCRLRQRQAKRY